MTSEVLLGNKHWATITLSNAERYAANGFAWYIGTGLQTLSSIGDYISVNFTTPDIGNVILQFADIKKTGDDLTYNLIEAGTYAGGTATTLYNYNRIIGDSVQPFVVKTGISTGGATVTGGTVLPTKYVPGISTGSTTTNGGASSDVNFIILKPNINYTLKITALGTNTKVDCILSMAYIPVNLQ